MAGTGGARVGAGRPKKLTPADASAALLTAAVYELSIGQSSVKLTLDSKSQVKPEVHVFHKSVRTASKMARAIFDELITAYCTPPLDETKPK